MLRRILCGDSKTASPLRFLVFSLPSIFVGNLLVAGKYFAPMPVWSLITVKFSLYYCVPVLDGKAIWNDEILWGKVGALGESVGLEWGGRWARFPDRPHFQRKRS